MSSKEKIIAAAIEVFAEKGKHGARMEEIAAHAKINKAMLYYFYTTKDNLFREVLSVIMQGVVDRICAGVKMVIAETNDPVETLTAIVRSHFDAYASNLKHTKILLEAFAVEPQEVKKIALNLREKNEKGPTPQKMIKFLENGIAEGVFRNINPKQIMISIIGMTMVYFSSKHISQTMLQLDVKDEKKFLNERRESIIDLLLYGIMNKRSA